MRCRAQRSKGNAAWRQDRARATDADAAARERWTMAPPYVDPEGYGLSAQTLTDLAAALTNPYLQWSTAGRGLIVPSPCCSPPGRCADGARVLGDFSPEKCLPAKRPRR